jgi:uncharacterized coiled-coil protein SlyX
VSHDARIEQLEIKIAHLEAALADLSDVVYRHERLLEAAAERHARLLERLEAADRQVSAEQGFEIPPHY